VLAALLYSVDLFVEQVLVVHVKVATLVKISATLLEALNAELVFVTQLEQVFLPLLKPEGCGDLVIHVQLNGLEYDVAGSVDYVAKPVNEIASSIDQSLALVQQLATVAAHDDEVAHVVDFEVAHDVSQLEVRNLLLGLEHLLLLLLGLLLRGLAFVGARDVVYHVFYQALREIVVHFSFFLNEHFHVAFVHLFTLYLEQLSKISLGAPTHGLHLALGEGVQCALSLCVDVVDQEVCVCLFDVINLSGEHHRVWQVLQPCGRQGERVPTRTGLFTQEVAVYIVGLFLDRFLVRLVSRSDPALVAVNTR